MRIYPGRNDAREVVIRFKARDRETAQFVLDLMYLRIPPGHVWERESFARGRKPGRSSDGARVGVTFVMFHNDPDTPALTDAEVVAIFGPLTAGE